MAKQKKINPVALFFLFFLKAVVIILGLVILAMGTYLLRAYILQKDVEAQDVVDENAFEDNQEDELLTAQAIAEDDLLFEVETEDPTEEVQVTYVPEDTVIAVLNATNTGGLAAAWKTKLEEMGYTNVVIGNYLNGKLETSKIVMSDQTLGVVKGAEDIAVEIESLDTVSADAPGADIVIYIIIGSDKDIVSSPE